MGSRCDLKSGYTLCSIFVLTLETFCVVEDRVREMSSLGERKLAGLMLRGSRDDPNNFAGCSSSVQSEDASRLDFCILLCTELGVHRCYLKRSDKYAHSFPRGRSLSSGMKNAIID